MVVEVHHCVVVGLSGEGNFRFGGSQFLLQLKHVFVAAQVWVSF